MSEKCHIAIYLRLSAEDSSDTRNKESGSISSQRKILLNYIQENQELAECIIEEFCDDGYSGTNLNRPGIQHLLAKIKQGSIDTVLVKDMSRFSRNYLEMGKYLNQIFPFMGIRFIAVNDGYDSKKRKEASPDADIVFQTLLYDFYSKDISSKVKASFQNKCSNGEWVFGQLPLGYKKDKENKGKIVIDSKEADIVRYIFSLADQGMSCIQIAKILYRNHIPTARQLRSLTSKELPKNQTWSDAAVRKILKNRFYLGEMAYGKSICTSSGNQKRTYVPEDKWEIIPNHHEPLISHEVFSRVSSSHGKPKKTRKKRIHPLIGKVYCGGCGYSMSYKHPKNGEKYRYFWCRKHALLQIPDCCTYFPADGLEKSVLQQLSSEAAKYFHSPEQSSCWEELQKAEQKKQNSLKKQYRLQLRRLQEKKDDLYEKYAKNQLNAEDYRLLAGQLTEKIEEVSKYLHTFPQKSSLSFDELTKETADLWIKKITLYSGKRLEIEWNLPRTCDFHTNLPSSGWGALDVSRLLAENISDKNCQSSSDMI